MYSGCTRMVNSCPWPHTHHFPCTVRPHWPLPKWLQQVWMAVAGSNGYSRPKWLQQAQNGFGAWSKVLVPQPSLSCQLHCSLGEWNKVLQAGDFLPRAHTACVVQHARDTPMFDATEIISYVLPSSWCWPMLLSICREGSICEGSSASLQGPRAAQSPALSQQLLCPVGAGTVAHLSSGTAFWGHQLLFPGWAPATVVNREASPYVLFPLPHHVLYTALLFPICPSHYPSFIVPAWPRSTWLLTSYHSPAALQKADASFKRCHFLFIFL